MKIKISYFKYNPLSNDTHPSVYVYFSEDDLTGDQKYIRSKTDAFQYSDAAGADPAAADYTDSPLRSENAVYTRSDGNLFSGPYNFDETGAENNLKTKEVIISFDPDSSHPGNSNVAGESPKWATIVLFGAATTTAHELKVKEVSLEWELKTANIISKSMQETLASQAVIDMNSNTSAAQTAADAAQLAATTANTEAVAAAAAAATASETAVGAATYAKNTMKDVTEQKSTTVNGKFGILDNHDQPAGVMFLNFADGTNVGNYDRGTQTSWVMENDDGTYLRIKGHTNRRRAIMFPAVSIPENHYVEMTFRYKGGGSNGSSKPAWRIYSTGDNIDESVKTHIFPDNSEWYFGNTDKDFVYQTNVSWQGESFDEKSDWTTVTVRKGFDWNDDPPKYVSVALQGAWNTSTGDSNRDLLVKFVNMTFKKASYRADVLYPTDIIPQRGDQFFRITDNDDYGWLSTYGKSVYDFKVAGQLIGSSTQTSRWPPMINRLWTDSTSWDGTLTAWNKITCQPLANVYQWSDSHGSFGLSLIHISEPTRPY